jgi:very-short-patch-repair endonuclease
MFKCKFCDKEYDKPTQLGGHIVRCKSNPNLKEIKCSTFFKYNKNPKKCKNCNNIIPYDNRVNDFCNRSCSGSYNNLNRNSEVYEKLSKTLSDAKSSMVMYRNGKRYNSYNEMVGDYYTSPKKCIICNSVLDYESRKRKTCSKECKTKYQSNKQKERLKLHPHKHPSVLCSKIRDKRSYPEIMLEDYLIDLGLIINVDYIPQHPIGKYVVDFFFPKLKLIIEVDGEYWHNLESDRELVREDYLIKSNFNIIHFWAKNITTKKHHTQIKELVLKAGNA